MDKRRVFSLVLEIYSKVNSIKRSKRTAYKELEILRNYKAPIGILPIYYIWDYSSALLLYRLLLKLRIKASLKYKVNS